MADRAPKAGAPTATINEVARKAGVSKALVSFVFNNRPGVAESTRERVRQAAAELGWRPSVRARILSNRTTYALGLVLRRDASIVAADPFYPAFLAGMETALADQGRVLVLSVVPDAKSEERTYRTLAADQRVDGVLLTDLRHHDARLRLLRSLGLPAVLVGSADQRCPYPSVTLDDGQGIRDAVAHLVSLGHRQIAHVAGDPAFLHARHRRAAFETAMREAGADPSLVIDTDFSMVRGAAATRALLARAKPPTAIIYANDPMAIAGLAVLQEHGLSVPTAMSIVGFDGTEMARHTFPALTTIESDAEQWGNVAAHTLLRLLADGHAQDVQLPPARLILANSTAGARSSHPFPTLTS